MAGKLKYVKITVASTDATNLLSGYRVLGDSIEGGARILFLERPEQAAATPRKPRTAKKPAAAGSAVSFPGVPSGGAA